MTHRPLSRLLGRPSDVASGSAMGLKVATFAALALACTLQNAHAQSNDCGQLGDGYGPFDYRVERKNHLKVVEDHHFTPEVEQLRAGKTGAIGADIDYTLRAFPNHHRALLAMVKLGEKLKTDQPQGSRYTVSCWLERAIKWRPDDTTARLIYAQYLGGKNRVADAVKQLEYTAELAGDNEFTHHTIGLIYLEIKDYPRALTAAHTAYKLGLDKPQLRDSLKALGQWVDLPEASASAAGQSRPAAVPRK